MIVDMKYHIASLAAVFLALAIGIAMGMSIQSNDVVAKQQQEITKVLKQDFQKLRKDNTELSQKVVTLESDRTANESFAKAVVPNLVDGRLFEKNIGIIETGDNLFSKDSLKTLTTAGANICSVTSVSEDFAANAAAQQAKLSSIIGNSAVNKNNVQAVTLKLMVHDIVEGRGAEALQSIDDLGLIHISGDYKQPLDAVVILAGNSKDDSQRIKQILIPLIGQLKTYDIRLAGTEFSTANYSDVKYFQKENIPTVDNVDNTVGQFALVLVLEGSNGNYGIKKTADRLLPDFK